MCLTDEEGKALVGLIRRIRDSGITIVWIEHVVHALVAAASRIVLGSGRVTRDRCRVGLPRIRLLGRRVFDRDLAGARGYVNPEWSAKAAAEPGGSRVSNQPTAVWPFSAGDMRISSTARLCSRAAWASR